ncbi:MAG: TonB-dependent receptor [Steroidobacteraceae bacterium]
MLACAGGLASTSVAADPALPLEQVVVTATRRPEPTLDVPLSIGRVGPADLELVGATHHAEVLNRLPGVMIQEGSGQESLTSIRSPVLTGPGSCGAFLFLENGVPVRPVGFCNVNVLYEVNTEQAQAVEVLRGPGSALYGSNAMFGTVNVLQPAPSERPRAAAGIEFGPWDYWRGTVEGRTAIAGTDLGGAGFHAHDGGWRKDSGYDLYKLNVGAAGDWGGVRSRVDFAAMDLDQETAGFITGKDAYEDESIARTNPTPGAFRRASAFRLTGVFEPEVDGIDQVALRPFVRASRTRLLQHFLLGQPVESNGQESGGLLACAGWNDLAGWSLIAGADAEFGYSWLREYQDQPTTGGTPPQNAIRPAGLHYDYDVHSSVQSLYAQVERRFLERLRLNAGLRAEWVTYDYSNRMLDGNTDDQGVPCTPAGCLYSRPADRTDHYSNWAPKLAVSWDLSTRLVAYLNGTLGFRPPEMTELYRLQRTQRVADLSPEQLRSIELGLKGDYPTVAFELAAYDMDRSGVILRDANGENVSNGRTTHRGVEYDLRWRPVPTVEIAAAGTYALHRYGFTRRADGGERIERGNDMDTAPRETGRYGIEWRPTGALAFEAELMVVGPYWLDAANEHRYGGYELVNLRGLWRFAPEWTAALRVTNALDERYAARADYAFGTYRYFPGEPRAIYAELGWRL